MDYIFIVNPKSRTGQGELLWSQLEPELKKRRVSYEVRMTGRKKDAERIATEITADEEEHTMIVLGGDGSLNEVINGIKNPSKVTLGYIPTGSSNDFARGMGIPKDAKKALELILNSEKIEKLDVGELVLGGKRRRFLVSAGMGFDAAVCHEVCISKWKKILNRLKLGKLSYAVVALNRLLKDQPVRMEIRLDDGSVHRFERAYFAAFMNQKYEVADLNSARSHLRLTESWISWWQQTSPKRRFCVCCRRHSLESIQSSVALRSFNAAVQKFLQAVHCRYIQTVSQSF